jgi:hypothetical protein
VFCDQVSKRLKELLTDLERRLKDLQMDLYGITDSNFTSWQTEDYQTVLRKTAVVLEFHAATKHLLALDKKKQASKGTAVETISERVAQVTANWRQFL